MKHTKMLCVSLLSAMSIFAMQGCRPDKEASQGAPTGPMESSVLAQVGDTVVTVGDYQQQVSKVPPSQKALIKPNVLLDGLIANQVLVMLAVREGLDKSPAYASVPPDQKKNWLAQAYVMSRMGTPPTPADMDRVKQEISKTRATLNIRINQKALDALKASGSK